MGTQREIKKFVYGKLKRLQVLSENQCRAELAQLRRGVGHAPGELPELWGSFLAEMPAELQGIKTASHAEWAIYLALTYYALHQQGNEANMNREGNGLGGAVRELAERNTSVQDWESSSVLRRFNALATAGDIYEISHHLRGLVQLLRSAKGGGILWIIRCWQQNYTGSSVISRSFHISLRISSFGGDRIYTGTKTRKHLKRRKSDYGEAFVC